jgi:hypothetical protein
MAVNAKPAERKKTPALDLEEPCPLSIMTINKSGAVFTISAAIVCGLGDSDKVVNLRFQ